MYTLKVRDHLIIAHSLKEEAFGPAKNLHGASYVVDAEYQCDTLDENNVVIDVDLASNLLRQVLIPLNYQNLDEVEIFNGKLTTAEFLAYFIHQEIAKAMAGIFTGNLKITLCEAQMIWASYEGRV